MTAKKCFKAAAPGKENDTQEQLPASAPRPIPTGAPMNASVILNSTEQDVPESTNGNVETQDRKRDLSRGRSLERGPESGKRRRSRSRAPDIFRRRIGDNDEDYEGDDDSDEEEHRPKRHRRTSNLNLNTAYMSDLERMPPPMMDDAPILHKIYFGHITSVEYYGAFVVLHGIRREVEGIVPLSHLANFEIRNPYEYMKRGQSVKVKVLVAEEERVVLSMKLVNQRTGMNRVPQISPPSSPFQLDDRSRSRSRAPSPVVSQPVRRSFSEQPGPLGLMPSLLARPVVPVGRPTTATSNGETAVYEFGRN